MDPAIATFWLARFPDLADFFEDDIGAHSLAPVLKDTAPHIGGAGSLLLFKLTIATESYRPVWGVASEAKQGYKAKFVTVATHQLEGFDVDLANECNCADVYYLLKDLEDISKQAPCGSFAGITVRDYLLPELADIKAGREYSDRRVTIEVEASGGSMSLGNSRSLFGTKVIFQILD